MKTIAVNNRSNLFKVLAVVGALGAIYFYRRRGGSEAIRGWMDQGKDLAGRVREQATDMYNNLTDTDEATAKGKGQDKESVAAKSSSRADQPSKSRSHSETSSVH